MIEAKDSETIYEIPMVFENEGLADLVVRRLGLPDSAPNMAEWHDLVRRVKQPADEVNIAVVGKYTQNGDAYISIAEALKHGGIACDARINIEWIESDDLEVPGLDLPPALPERTASWSPPASASAAWKAKSARSNMPAKAACPSSASATACKWP